MDFKDLARALRKRWRFIVICTLLCLGAAAAFTALQTPKYQAEIQLFVAARDQSSNTTSAYQGGLFTQSRVVSYVDLVAKQPVLQPVVDQLHLPYSWQQLASEVSADSPTNTVLINVNVLDPSPSRARDIANAIGTQFSTFVSALETLDNTGSPVKVSTSQRATLPAAPATPKVPLNLVLGLLVGLAIGTGGAVLRESLDTSVKSAEELRERFSTNTLGVIAYDSDAPKHPLIVKADPKAHRGEAFRQLRTNLQFIEIDRQPRSILVTSSVPGEGKTTTACNLAITLAQVGVDVILVEGDLRRPKLAEYLGLENAVGVTSVLVGWAELDDVLQPWGPENLKLRVLASGPTPPNPSELLSSEQLRQLLTRLEDSADVVIIDAPPLLPVADAAILAASASGILVVVRHGKTKREQLTRAFEALRAVDARVFGSILNMVPLKGLDSDYYYGYGYTYAARPGLPEGASPAPAEGHVAVTAAPANGAGPPLAATRVSSTNGRGASSDPAEDELVSGREPLATQPKRSRRG